MWDLWWTMWRRGRFSPSTSVSPAIHSTKFSILTITRGRYNRSVSSRRAEWTQFGLHPPLCKLKKIKNYSLLREYMFIQPLTRDGRCSVFDIHGNAVTMDMSPKAPSQPRVTVYFVTMRTCLAKLRPADTQFPAFNPQVTIHS
jgi:hypothetical protein